MAKRPPQFVNPYADFEHARDTGRQRAGDLGRTPEVTAWSALVAGKTLGKRIVLPFSQTDLPSSLDIFTITGEDKYAMPVVVTLGSPKLIPVAPPFPANVQAASGEKDNLDFNDAGGVPVIPVEFAPSFAVVEWGIGGVSQEAEVDMSNGLCINLQASWVRLRGSIQSMGGLGQSGLYVQSAFIGPGYAKSPNAQRSLFFNGGGVGSASVRRPVPRFAKYAMLAGFNTAAVYTGRLQFFTDNAAAATLVEYVFTTTNRDPVPIPNGAYYFRVVNDTAGAGANNTQTIFELGI